MFLHIPHIHTMVPTTSQEIENLILWLIVIGGMISLIFIAAIESKLNASVRFSSAPVKKQFHTTPRRKLTSNQKALIQTAEAIKTIAESNGLPISTVLTIVDYFAAIAATKKPKI